jgi:hypothetical protein
MPHDDMFLISDFVDSRRTQVRHPAPSSFVCAHFVSGFFFFWLRARAVQDFGVDDRRNVELAGVSRSSKQRHCSSMTV